MDASIARMVPPRFESAHPELDFLLAEVAEAIQGEYPTGRAVVESAVRKLAERHKANRDAGRQTYSVPAGLNSSRTTSKSA